MAMQADIFTAARKHMVDSQIRPNKVTDPRILTAMRHIPRERFLPQNVQALAYADEDVPLGNGRFLLEPMVMAKLLQAASLQEQERVLVVGAGIGYGAAVLAACGCRVTALEEDPSLFATAESVLATEAPGVMLVCGPLRDGWAANAPYDLVLIEGAVPEIPAPRRRFGPRQRRPAWRFSRSSTAARRRYRHCARRRFSRSDAAPGLFENGFSSPR
jgi:protein-L-isoaspartate(D-aspartate) O-methyltransferase